MQRRDLPRPMQTLAVIDAIHEAALDPTRWPDARGKPNTTRTVSYTATPTTLTLTYEPSGNT